MTIPPMPVFPTPKAELPSVELLREAPSPQAVESMPPAEAPTPQPAIVREPEALYEPRELTFEEVCRYLNLKPDLRKFFVNKRGEYVRKLVEEYRWSIDEEKRVHKIPKWFINEETW